MAKKRRAKQGRFEGMEPPSIAVIDTAAEEYVEARDERMALLKTEVERHDKLLELMKEHDLPTYEFDGYVVTVVNQAKAKVKRKAADEEEIGEDEE